VKTIIIGGSISGIYTAILLKRKHPDTEVMVLEKESKPCRKIYATGNGRCNILNANISSKSFNHPLYMEETLSSYPYSKLKETLESFGIILSEEGDLVYPLTFSASSFVSQLLSYAEILGVRILCEQRVFSYEQKGDGYEVKTEENSYLCDSLVIAVGGASSPKLGSDGFLHPLLQKKGYSWVPLTPGLCPIKVTENVKSLDGSRHKAKVSVMIDNRVSIEETGEILFKKDGLSGICVFNVSNVIEQTRSKLAPVIYVDLFPNIVMADLVHQMEKVHEINGPYFLSSFLTKPLEDYVIKVSKTLTAVAPDKLTYFNLAKAMKGLCFHYAGSYGFASSQISIGGLSLSEVDSNLISRREKNVAFVGEVLDLDGFCGGNNLSWALISALKVSEVL